MAESTPTMAVTMPLSWIKWICFSKITGGSLSKPTMNPPSHLHACLLDMSYRCQQIAIFVLQFAALDVPLLERGLDADKKLLRTLP